MLCIIFKILAWCIDATSRAGDVAGKRNFVTEGCVLFTSGYALATRAYVLFTRGYTLFAQGCALLTQGCALFAQGYTLFTQGYALFARECFFSATSPAGDVTEKKFAKPKSCAYICNRLVS